MSTQKRHKQRAKAERQTAEPLEVVRPLLMPQAVQLLALCVCVAVGGGCRYVDGVAVVIEQDATGVRVAAALMDIVVAIVADEHKVIRIQRYRCVPDIIRRQEFYMMHFFSRRAANLA